MRVTTIALAMGLVATNALARDFPYKPSPSQPAGIKEQGKYTMSIYHAVASRHAPSMNADKDGTQIGLPDPTESLSGRVPVDTGSPVSPVGYLSSIGKGARVMPDPTAIPLATANQRILAVHFGAETYYVTFGSDDDRKQYVKDLRTAMEKAGLSIKR